MSTPISFSSRPPSLLGNDSVPRKQDEEPLKQRRDRGRKKKSKQKSGGGGDTEPDISYAPDLIYSPPPSFQTTKREFRFSEDATETETRSVGSPENVRDSADFNASFYPQSGDSVSVGASDSRSTDSDSHSEAQCLESVVGRQLFELPCIHGLVNSFKAQVKINVLKQVRAMFDKEPTTELVLEIADSIDLLRILGASDPKLDVIGKNAREGALLYGKGLQVMNRGRAKLRWCFVDVSLLK